LYASLVQKYAEFTQPLKKSR